MHHLVRKGQLMIWPTTNDLRVFLGAEFSDPDEESRAQLLLDLAVGAVEGEAGQPLESGEVTSTVDGTGTGVLVLPRWPVTAVATVTVDDTAVDGFTFSTDGRLRRTGDIWTSGHANIEVAYTAGFTTVSRDLWKVVLEAAAAAWGTPPNVTQETLGDHSVSYGRAHVQLNEEQARVARRYQANTVR